MTHAPQPAPEVKSGDADLAQAFDTFQRTFETFKEGNDDRLDQIERKLSADVVTVDKVDRINRALDEQKRAVDQLVLKGRRPPLGSDGSRVIASPEHKAAFEAYVRNGNEDGLQAARAEVARRRLRRRLPGAGGDRAGDRPAAG